MLRNIYQNFQKCYHHKIRFNCVSRNAEKHFEIQRELHIASQVAARYYKFQLRSARHGTARVAAARTLSNGPPYRPFIVWLRAVRTPRFSAFLDNWFFAPLLVSLFLCPVSRQCVRPVCLSVCAPASGASRWVLAVGVPLCTARRRVTTRLCLYKLIP